MDPIDYRTQDWQPIVRELTGNRGVDLIIDPIGGSIGKKAMRRFVTQED